MIHHVVPTLHKELGGVDVAVRCLSNALRELDVEHKIHTLTPPLNGGGQNPGLFFYSQAKWLPSRLGWSASMRRGLDAHVRPGDIVHNHSLWMMPNIYAGNVARRAGCVLLNSPHGTLSRWARGRSSTKKRMIQFLGQRRALASTGCFHATSDSELEDLRNLGFDQPIAIIPNGVELPPTRWRRLARSEDSRFRVLFLARLHPTKGLADLLWVWGPFKAKHPNAELIVAGPDEGQHGEEMRRLAADLKLSSIRFAGPVVGAAKSDLYGSADLYVLPTYSENFGLTVAEALAHGTPVITTTAAPWNGLNEHRCGWWIDKQSDALLAAMMEAHETGADDRNAMGRRGREWMQQAFSWPSVAGRMTTLYGWLRDGGERPEWVHT